MWEGTLEKYIYIWEGTLEKYKVGKVLLRNLQLERLLPVRDSQFGKVPLGNTNLGNYPCEIYIWESTLGKYILGKGYLWEIEKHTIHLYRDPMLIL